MHRKRGPVPPMTALLHWTASREGGWKGCRLDEILYLSACKINSSIYLMISAPIFIHAPGQAQTLHPGDEVQAHLGIVKDKA